MDQLVLVADGEVWGGMSRHMVADDLARGALVAIELEASPVRGAAFLRGWRWCLGRVCAGRGLSQARAHRIQCLQPRIHTDRGKP
jgi:hypothetical protein